MPSRISHLWVARRAVARWLSPSLSATVLHEVYPYLALGAQGPDLFLHNHRRRPRGILYGALLHRKGNDAFLAALADGALNAGSEVAAYAVGWATHVVLDRLGHPYVNYFAGWRGHPDSTDQRRYMHPWLERLLDVQWLQLKQEDPSDWAFTQLLASSDQYIASLVGPITSALRAALSSTETDDFLEERVTNAILDTIGFYFHTDMPKPRHLVKARRTEREGRAPERWMALLHPPADFIPFDVMNRSHVTWCHPCDSSILSDHSWPQILETAVTACGPVLSTMERYWENATPAALAALKRAVGVENLNDGIGGDPPCPRRYTRPLPLVSLYDRIKRRLDTMR